jgi:hypothetical protein
VKRSIEIAIRIALYGGIVVLTLLLAPGVSFHYLAPQENDPLTNSVKVTSLSTDSLKLADGRVVLIATAGLERDFEQGTLSVELQEIGLKDVIVFVKTKTFICGTGGPRFVIPLIPQHFPKYQRQAFGPGTLL